MRRRVVALGLAAVLGYVGAVVVVARTDPFLARPILDGLAPPPLYRWVAPPPAFASTNQPPASGHFVLSPAAGNYDPAQGSGAGVFGTSDFQVSLALSARAIDPATGAASITLSIEPLAPDADASVPAGYRIAGNVIHVTAAYRPTGGSVSRLPRPSLLTLSYPIVVQGGYSNTLLVSSDARRWTPVKSTDHPGQQFVLATVHSLGYFAVGQASGGGTPASSAAPRRVPRWVIAALAAMGVVALIVALALRGRKRPSPPSRRPPSDDSDAFDPWKV